MQLINYKGKFIEIAAPKMELISLGESWLIWEARKLLHLQQQGQEVKICMVSKHNVVDNYLNMTYIYTKCLRQFIVCHAFLFCNFLP